jgi:hypothetical protein
MGGTCKGHIQYQGLTFEGVGVHHQHIITEGRIRELQKLATTMMIYANRWWLILPYAVMNVNNVLNEAPLLHNKKMRSPLQVFSGTNVAINIKHYIPFGCPVYMLDANLQRSLPHHK